MAWLARAARDGRRLPLARGRPRLPVRGGASSYRAASLRSWVVQVTVFEQPDAASVRAQHAQVVTALEAKFPQAATHLDEARHDILAFTAFPREVWRQIWSNNPRNA